MQVTQALVVCLPAGTSTCVLLLVPRCPALQYGTIDFPAVTAELLVSRSDDGTFLSIQGL